MKKKNLGRWSRASVKKGVTIKKKEQKRRKRSEKPPRCAGRPDIVYGHIYSIYIYIYIYR